MAENNKVEDSVSNGESGPGTEPCNVEGCRICPAVFGHSGGLVTGGND